MPAGSPTNDQAIEAMRVRRAELSESMSALEQALAAPAPGRLDAWAERVHVALVELVSDFRGTHRHRGGTERGVPRGTEHHAAALRCGGSPTREHAAINDLIDQLLTRVGLTPVNDGVNGVRDLGTALLVRLIRSRQRSADPVYEAYQFDIGGEA